MGFESRSMSVTGLTSSHNSERDCEHGALWHELELRTSAIAAEPRYEPVMVCGPGVLTDDEDRPEWTLDDWRAGRPCTYGDRHNHHADEAPPAVQDGAAPRTGLHRGVDVRVYMEGDRGDLFRGTSDHLYFIARMGSPVELRPVMLPDEYPDPVEAQDCPPGCEDHGRPGRRA